MEGRLQGLEYCHFLEGRCILTPEGGKPIELKAGDVFVIEPGFKATCEVIERVRKYYVFVLRDLALSDGSRTASPGASWPGGRGAHDHRGHAEFEYLDAAGRTRLVGIARVAADLRRVAGSSMHYVIELSQHFPGEGAVYVWPTRLLGGMHGFLSGWCYAMANAVYVPTLIVSSIGLAHLHSWTSIR